jgi:small subunit ribosomal protein S13
MLIIFGKKLAESKKVRFGLTEVFGIGLSTANKLCNLLNIPPTITISELTETQKINISTYIKNSLCVETKLKQEVYENVETLKTINCVKGFRHRSKLPVRGQRTHSNAKTCKRVLV